MNALGHFNISDSTQFNAIVNAAATVGVPVWVGVSEGEKSFIDLHNAVALVQAARTKGKEVYLNLDHGQTVEDCKEAIDAGFDSVMFDGSKLSFEENVAKTQEVVAYARVCGRDVLVEGELGYIGSSSKLLDVIPEDVESAMTTPEQAQEFVAQTGVDILAPSVGNLHGMLKGGNPQLDIERIAAIKAVVPQTTLVLHGGSGISDDDFRAAIRAGIGIVHINTEIRKAYREGIEEGLEADPMQVAPYKYLNHGRDAVISVVTSRITLFTRL
jgi:fructose-bisphosphate aldolase class II